MGKNGTEAISAIIKAIIADYAMIESRARNASSDKEGLSNEA